MTCLVISLFTVVRLNPIDMLIVDNIIFVHQYSSKLPPNPTYIVALIPSAAAKQQHITLITTFQISVKQDQCHSTI